MTLIHGEELEDVQEDEAEVVVGVEDEAEGGVMNLLLNLLQKWEGEAQEDPEKLLLWRNSDILQKKLLFQSGESLEGLEKQCHPLKPHPSGKEEEVNNQIIMLYIYVFYSKINELDKTWALFQLFHHS